MKTTAVIGLGIIGGSICASLTKAGYVVDGTDINEKAVEYALSKGYIRAQATDISAYDVVFIAVPPRATLNVLETMQFKDGALVSDICGIKTEIEKAVDAKERNYRYVGIHPMAGKETSGIASASSELFHMANLIITVAQDTKESALTEIKEYAKAMRFGKIVECSADEHDRKIAITSQLAHIVSNAYVKSPQVPNCDGFTGGSFQDMTRIAGVDENIWTRLYMLNRDKLLSELDTLIYNLKKYQHSLKECDEEELNNLLKEGRLAKQKLDLEKPII